MPATLAIPGIGLIPLTEEGVLLDAEAVDSPPIIPPPDDEARLERCVGKPVDLVPHDSPFGAVMTADEIPRQQPLTHTQVTLP